MDNITFEIDPNQLRIYKNGEIIGQLEGDTSDLTEEDLDKIAEKYK